MKLSYYPEPKTEYITKEELLEVLSDYEEKVVKLDEVLLAYKEKVKKQEARLKKIETEIKKLKDEKLT